MAYTSQIIRSHVCLYLQPPYQTIAEHCNIWRNYGDIQDNWASVYSIIDHYGNNTDKFAQIAGPGQFNDPDEVFPIEHTIYYNKHLS